MFPDPARARPSGVASPVEAPYELHTASTAPATKTPVINGTEMRPHAAVPGEGEVQCRYEADLPEESYAEKADQMTAFK